MPPHLTTTRDDGSTTMPTFIISPDPAHMFEDLGAHSAPYYAFAPLGPITEQGVESVDLALAEAARETRARLVDHHPRTGRSPESIRDFLPSPRGPRNPSGLTVLRPGDVARIYRTLDPGFYHSYGEGTFMRVEAVEWRPEVTLDGSGATGPRLLARGRVFSTQEGALTGDSHDEVSPGLGHWVPATQLAIRRPEFRIGDLVRVIHCPEDLPDNLTRARRNVPAPFTSDILTHGQEAQMSDAARPYHFARNNPLGRVDSDRAQGGEPQRRLSVRFLHPRTADQTEQIVSSLLLERVDVDTATTIVLGDAWPFPPDDIPGATGAAEFTMPPSPRERPAVTVTFDDPLGADLPDDLRQRLAEHLLRASDEPTRTAAAAFLARERSDLDLSRVLRRPFDPGAIGATVTDLEDHYAPARPATQFLRTMFGSELAPATMRRIARLFEMSEYRSPYAHCSSCGTSTHVSVRCQSHT